MASLNSLYINHKVAHKLNKQKYVFNPQKHGIFTSKIYIFSEKRIWQYVKRRGDVIRATQSGVNIKSKNGVIFY
jgi:hypothetical protein